jgi:hypothetical protein
MGLAVAAGVAAMLAMRETAPSLVGESGAIEGPNT